MPKARKKDKEAKPEKNEKPLNWVKMHFRPDGIYMPWHDGQTHDAIIEKDSDEYEIIMDALKTLGIGPGA